jgi:hypothetical protein
MLSSSYGSVNVDINKILSVNVISIIWTSECYLHHMDQSMLISIKYYQSMLSPSYGSVNVDINKILSVNVDINKILSVNVDINKILSVNVIFIIWISEC